jgi:hypothetical protein
MGRWKGSPQGPYYDPNDTGPDQVAPPPGMGQNGQPLPQQAQPQMPPQSGLPTTPGLNGQPVYTGGYDPNSPLYGTSGSFGQIGQGGGKQAPPGYHYGMDWTSGQLFPDNPNDPNTPPMQKHGEGWMGGNDAPMGSGTLASLQPQKDSFGMKSGMDPNMTLGGWGKPTGQMGAFGSLSSLGNTLGSAGGNVLKKLF